MTERMIRKETRFDIINHWSMAVSCILLSITGYGFLFRVELIGLGFGGFNTMKTIHNWLGVIFTLSLLLSMGPYLKEALTFDADDLRWIRVAGGYLSHNVKSPPMGKINTGQKFFYLGLLFCGVGISVTGFLIWFMPGNKEWLRWFHLFHNLCFLYFVVSIPIHIYLGTFANPGSIQIMISGMVLYEWAKKKYPKWIAEVEQHASKH
jgi:formate dehydrogenase subunit gamma